MTASATVEQNWQRRAQGVPVLDREVTRRLISRKSGCKALELLPLSAASHPHWHMPRADHLEERGSCCFEIVVAVRRLQFLHAECHPPRVIVV